ADGDADSSAGRRGIGRLALRFRSFRGHVSAPEYRGGEYSECITRVKPRMTSAAFRYFAGVDTACRVPRGVSQLHGSVVSGPQHAFPDASCRDPLRAW